MATTYTTFKTKVQQDLDLEEENFVQSTEFLGYTNEGLREVEKEVLTIYEDYLLDNAYLALTTGTSKYNKPSGIFANKIRTIIYNNGSSYYEIKQFKGPHKFTDRAMHRLNTAAEYKYMILNNATNGIQIEISPASRETSSTNVEIFFIRSITAIALGADIVDEDIPECLNFLYAFVKGKCKEKENAGVMPADAQAEIDRQRKLLVETLTNMIPDDDNEVVQDASVYAEMS